jgi:hypothetical protein
VNHRFGMLATHFLGRFFDNEIVSQESNMRTNAVQALGLASSPGMLVAFFMLPQQLRWDQPFADHWILVNHYYFFVVYSMLMMGLVMVFEWDAIFPDRRDYLVLTPLPIGSGAIFAGKTAALAMFLCAFLAAINGFGTVIGTAVAAGSHTSWAVYLRIVLAHATAVVSGGLFVALVFAALQGLLINALTARAFRRISPWVQTASMGLLIAIFFLAPLISSNLPLWFESRSPVLRWFPPFWFLSLYLDLMPGRPGGAVFHEFAPLALKGLAAASLAFAVSYLAGYRRHSRRVMESLETAGHGPGAMRSALEKLLNRYLLPHPLERAAFHFISQTILRSARHRLFLASVAGIASAVVLPSLVRLRSGDILQPAFVAEGLAILPLMLVFFIVSGLRSAFNLPAELRANWLFQVCETNEQVRHIRAARKWIILVGMVPLVALLAPFEIWFLGWSAAAVHLGFAVAIALVMLNLLMIWFRKIPFTCSYFPGKTAMAAMAGLYFLGFVFCIMALGRLQARLMHSPAGLTLFFLVIGLVLAGLWWLERRELEVDSVLLYEDAPEPVVRSLELG